MNKSTGHDDISFNIYKKWFGEMSNPINPTIAGLFEGSFSCEEGWVNLTSPSYFKKNLTNINITLYDC